MPEEPEVETHELQETIEELQEERRERAEEERKSSWTRYVALTTACLAVFAAIAAMRSGALVNEAMIDQIRAADTWNQYQADRLKDHTFTIAANSLLDAGAFPTAEKPAHAPQGAMARGQGGHAGAGEGNAARSPRAPLKALTPAERLAYYEGQIEKEAAKEDTLNREAVEKERESQHSLHEHHRFAYSVAFIQVAIALAAVAALVKSKPVWFTSLAIGLVGVAFFVAGFVA